MVFCFQATDPHGTVGDNRTPELTVVAGTGVDARSSSSSASAVLLDAG